MRSPGEISHHVALAGLAFRQALRCVAAARAAPTEECRLNQEAKASKHFLAMEQHLLWARATAFEVRKRNPATEGYDSCGHQHPSVAAAKECQAAWFGDKPYGTVRVVGTPDLDEWWTPEQGRFQAFCRQQVHENALVVARTTPPRKKLTRQQMLTETGLGFCAIIGCASMEAPGDTGVCLECHKRLYQEAEAERTAQAAATPSARRQLALF
jgi:hypothetical protein